MILKRWDVLPEKMRCPEVKKYYDVLSKKKGSLIAKRVFDVVVASLMLVVLSPVMLLLGIAIKLDSKGPVFFRQVRVTTYGKEFRIFKFRTMVNGADKKGTQITTAGDARVTRVGRVIRKCRLDETAQLLDVIRGTMTFVGVRPEVPKYVDQYKPEWLATLLLPAGVTNLTSIYYQDEDKLLDNADSIDSVYIEKVLPGKMKWNLKGLEHFSFFLDIKLMFMTFFSMCGKNYTASTEKDEELKVLMEINKS